MLTPMHCSLPCGNPTGVISVRDVWIETPRLILREHSEGDLDSVLAYASDPEVLCWSLAPRASRDEIAASLARITEQRAEQPIRRLYNLAVVRRSGNALIGWIPLVLSDEAGCDGIEIGWTVARTEWGHGYATEAAAAALAFVFETLGSHRLWARARPENVGSLRVMEKLGMQKEAHFRRCRFVNGCWTDLVYYSLLREELDARKRSSVENRHIYTNHR